MPGYAAPRDVRAYVAGQLRELLDSAPFLDALPGFLMPYAASEARQAVLLERFRALSDLGA